MRERRRDYEILYIVSPLKTSEEDINAVIGRVTASITALGGEVTSSNNSAPWGRRRFAYPMREYAEGEASRRIFTEGHYVLSHFSIGAAKIAEFERALKFNDSVLRFLLTLVEQKKPVAEPAAEPVAEPVAAS